MKKKPEEIFRKYGGQLRMSEAISHGITRYMLYSLRDRGVLEQVSRGIYRLVELPPVSNPALDFPPVQGHRFSNESFKAGIDEHHIDGALVRIYSPEKTLIDCFKFRNKIGMDVFLEALQLYKTRRSVETALLLNYAKICRVEKPMRPYLEMMF